MFNKRHWGGGIKTVYVDRVFEVCICGWIIALGDIQILRDTWGLGFCYVLQEKNVQNRSQEES